MRIKKPRVFLGKELQGQKNRLKISMAELSNFERTPDYMFWMCHGVNFLNSDLKEGIWNPLFDWIYTDSERLENYTLRDALRQIGGHSIQSISGKMALWVVQQPIVLYELNHYAKQKPSLRNPADSEMWAYFHAFMSKILGDSLEEVDVNQCVV
jgi:hypothetical protein